MSEIEKPRYMVVVYRRMNLEPIILTESEDFDSCFSVWETNKNKWAESSKEAKPFELTSPIVTAFEPALIYEICLVPAISQNFKAQSNNPYTKDMKQRGFTEALRGYSPRPDILDSGFTPY